MPRPFTVTHAMTALELVLGKAALEHGLPPSPRRTTVDLVVDGMNLTARVPDADLAPMVRDLAMAVADLSALRGRRRSLRCYSSEGPWELGLCRWGLHVDVSLYRGGPHPEVALFERRVTLAALRAATEVALHQLAERTPTTAASSLLGLSHELAHARRALSETAVALDDGADSRHSVIEVLAEQEGGALRIAAQLGLRTWDGGGESSVERADLFALLVRGTLSIGVGERTRVFADKFVFLFAERLVSLAAQVLDAWEHAQPYYRRLDVYGVVVGLRVLPAESAPGAAQQGSGDREPGVFITVGEPRPCPPGDARTFRLPDANALVGATVAFGRSLARALVRHDPTQKQNLRLTAFRRAVRALDERWTDATCDDSKVNPSPELYRAFAAPSERATCAREAAKLRFAPGFVASFPGIDLRASFLCGDRLIIGSARETACLDRRTGEFLWRRPTLPAVSVVTPSGVARLFADGSLALHDFDSGEVSLATRLAPRVGGVVTGAVISAPGLPRLLVVSEGKRHLSAIDLTSGEVRWRHSAQGGAVFRLRRAGKLLIVVAADATLSALDLSSGEVVWRTRDRFRFASPVGLDHDSLFAVAGQPESTSRTPSRLHHLDPYAGTTRWVRDLPDGTVALGAPLVSDGEVILVTRDRRGLGLLGLERASGSTVWSSDPGLFPVSSAWLAVDNAIVINSESGHLLSISAETGVTLWSHRFPRGMEGDQPRKLEPILRSGALFVPQQQVHVVRPRDGALLGRVTSELIPDFLRVDECCDVYVAEESGHLASFRAGAKLSLV